MFPGSEGEKRRVSVCVCVCVQLFLSPVRLTCAWLPFPGVDSNFQTKPLSVFFFFFQESLPFRTLSGARHTRRAELSSLTGVNSCQNSETGSGGPVLDLNKAPCEFYLRWRKNK